MVGFLASCGDSTSSRLAEPASLTMIPASTTLDAIGETLMLQVTVRDAVGNPIPGSAVTYTSAAPDVVTVSATGLVTAVSPGATEVIASVDELTRSSAIAVVPAPAVLARVSGDGQAAEVNTTVADPLVVEVRDRRDHPIADVDVSFSLGLSPGALSSTAATTGTDGRASTVLSLDTIATEYRVTATASSGEAAPTTFVVTGVPGPAAVATVLGGDGQRQPAGRELPDDLVALVTDQYGNGIAGAAVLFSVTAGGGSVSVSMATTNASGEARTRWTLGSTVGVQTVEADAGIGSGVLVYSATATDLVITGITPATLVAGQAGQVTGTGFDPDPTQDTITVDGELATITGATTTTLDFVVPEGQCRPAQDVAVAVSTALGGTTDPTFHPGAPASPVALTVGEQMILQDPDQFCLQFLAAAPYEEYLVGVQSVSSIANTVTVSRLVGETAPGATVQALSFSDPVVGPERAVEPLTPRMARWYRHREGEIGIRKWERQRLATGAFAPVRTTRVSRASAIDSTVQVGDIVPIKVPTLGSDLCATSASINAVVKAVGQRGIWLHDPANPPGGFTDADYQALSDLLDTLIYDTDVAYFGTPTDLDQNGRIVVVISEQVNDNSNTVLGFVTLSDLETASTCAASNEGEVYYGRAPASGTSYARSDALEDAGALIAHEFTHIIQGGRRLVINGSSQFMAAFMAEGQATLAEEVNGHAALGNTPGQNYGYDVAFNTAQTVPELWYAVALTDVSYYFGRNSGSNLPVEGAPEECGWMTGDPSPCQGRALWYGVTWSFLRWINDQFAASFIGGEQDIQRALVDNTRRGLDNIANVVGVPADSLLAQWGAALYVDERVTGASARLTMPSWDFVDIFEVHLPASAVLSPQAVDFDTWDSNMSVIAGSAAYFRIRGSNRPDVAFRVRGLADQPLPGWMQVFLVRIQ